MSFGIRRAHPVLAPMIDRACYIAGFDTVSSLIGAKLLGKKPTGTMPHSLIVTIGNQKQAWLAFDKHTPADVPRIMLIDTYCDEKTESIMAAETLGKKLAGVRLDTPASRRGNILDILREVRWELDARGFDHVKIFVSGGLDEDKVRLMADAGADGFGVGTSVSNAPSIDFAMDIVEADGKLVAKRGKLGGEKKVWRCNNCILEQVTLANVENIPSCPKCGRPMHEFLETIVKNGILAKKLLSVDNIHDYVMKQLQIMTVSS
jgi:nicotinate phosphoribosyltransferase